MKFEPRSLASWQVAYDRSQLARTPALLARKIEKMRASPFAFLRGGAALFNHLLELEPWFAEGPRGEGWIAGDLHLENFGAYRPDHDKVRAVFDLNDFDEAIRGPWRFDVLRLATSVVVACRVFGLRSIEIDDALDTLLTNYARYVSRAGSKEGGGASARTLRVPSSVKRLLDRVSSRSPSALLNERTETKRGARRFVRGARYTDLEPRLFRALPASIDSYVEQLHKSDKLRRGYQIVDAARRIAGTGSLGRLRIAGLIKVDGGLLLLDLKEQKDPLLNAISRDHEKTPAESVATAARTLPRDPPRRLGTTTIGGRSMLVRNLTPQEDRLNVAELGPSDLCDLCGYLGALAGLAHRRGENSRGAHVTWNKSDVEVIRERSLALASIHDAAHVAYVRLTARS